MVKHSVEFGVCVGTVLSSRCGGGRMAGTDNGQFDLRALQRVGDFANDRAEWKRGAASPRVLELMNSVTEIQTELQLSPKRAKGALGSAEASNFAVES